MVVFIIYKFGSVWKNRKSSLTGRAQEQSGPIPVGLVSGLKCRLRPTHQCPRTGETRHADGATGPA
jgi:hypothetical protein